MSSGSDSNKKTGTTTTSQDPWQPLQAPLKSGINATTNAWKSGVFQDANTPYAGPTVAGISPLTQQSWNQVGDIAQNGTSAMNAGNQYITGLLKGDTSSLSPLINSTRNAVNATYEGAGRYGSGAHDSASTNAIGNVIANQMGNAASLAPQYQNAQLQAIQAGNLAGGQQQQQQQSQLDAAQNYYYQSKQAPINAINQYMNLLNGVNTGGTSQSAQYGGTSNAQNPWVAGAGVGASLLGGALAGGYL